MKLFTEIIQNGINMEDIRGEIPIIELCRKYGISTHTYYTWNKEFIETGKRQLSGYAVSGATADEESELCLENKNLKESLADLVARYDIVKKV